MNNIEEKVYGLIAATIVTLILYALGIPADFLGVYSMWLIFCALNRLDRIEKGISKNE